MSLPGAEWAINDYRSRTNNCKKRPIPHAEGGQVERGLASISHLPFIRQLLEPISYSFAR